MIELLQAFYDLQLGEYMFLDYDFFSCLVCFPQTNGPDSIYGLQLGEHMFLNYDLFGLFSTDKWPRQHLLTSVEPKERYTVRMHGTVLQS